MGCQWIKAEIQTNGVAKLVLNRPEKRNALNGSMILAIKQQLEAWKENQTIRALIICAEGETFCSGADIEWMKKAASFSLGENIKDASELGEMLQLLYRFPRPVISQVQGSAYGGALGIIAASDIVLSTPCATFCLSEVRLGLIPAIISPYLIEAMGVRQAKRYTLSAEIITAEKAHALGLIHEIVPIENLQSYTDYLVKQLLNGNPNAQMKSKELLQHVFAKELNQDLLQYTAKMIAQARVSTEGQEGTKAFLAKHKPSWAQ